MLSRIAPVPALDRVAGGARRCVPSLAHQPLCSSSTLLAADSFGDSAAAIEEIVGPDRPAGSADPRGPGRGRLLFDRPRNRSFLRRRRRQAHRRPLPAAASTAAPPSFRSFASTIASAPPSRRPSAPSASCSTAARQAAGRGWRLSSSHGMPRPSRSSIRALARETHQRRCRPFQRARARDLPRRVGPRRKPAAPGGSQLSECSVNPTHWRC